jgi:hypothetical protein
MSVRGRRSASSNDKIFNIILVDGKLTEKGRQFTNAAGIDPKSLMPMQLEDFYEKGQTDEITELSYSHYEQRRQLKLEMISELYEKDKQKSIKKRAAGTIKVNKAAFITPNYVPSRIKVKTAHNLSVVSRRKNTYFTDGNIPRLITIDNGSERGSSKIDHDDNGKYISY